MKLSKEELIEIARELMNPKTKDKRVEELSLLLKENVPHPYPTDLIFYNSVRTTPEEVIEIALNYKK